ncbi:MAG: Gfo/Idh/MocA family oxidoreductase [Thermodesulfobacteriota bacterium]
MTKKDGPVNVGLIGLGDVSRVHLAAYQSVETARIVAGADIDKARAEKMANQWGFTGYTDYHDMLKKEAIDAVVVCVPCRYHREVVEAVAGYGKPVLVEKPLAGSLEDGKAMIETCRKQNIPLMYGASYRFLPACIKAKKMIEENLLGDISMMTEWSMGVQGRENYTDLGEHHYYPGSFGGSDMGMVDHGVHLIDLFRWFLQSEVVSVYGKGNISCRTPGTEHATLNFDNGTTAHLIYNEITFSSDLESEGIYKWGGSWEPDGTLVMGGGWESHPGSIRVHGSSGALRIYHYANHLFHFDKDGSHPIALQNRPMPGNFGMQLESFIKSVRNDTLLSVPAEEGLKSLEVIEAIYKSMETQTIVTL